LPHLPSWQIRRWAERFRDCGVPFERIEVAGNLKFDAPLPDGVFEAGAALREAWGTDRPVLVAGSTREGDEDVLLPAFQAVLVIHPGALLVLAPRHPERFDRVASRLQESGLAIARHSLAETPGASHPVLLLDTMGVLMPHYAAADVAFVGGTLAPIGGHNLLEPASLGKPVLFGPHLANVREISAALLAAGAAREVTDQATLVTAITTLFDDAALRARMGEAAKSLVESGKGALVRTLNEIDRFLVT
jgi:3-deoxy-D-manno-octulosonic-acid transferase